MTIPNPYFKNVPGVGDLTMEQVIVDYVYPLLSVLTDNSKNRYLCMCFDTRGSQQWLITSISNSVLVALLKNDVTLSSPFENQGTKKFLVTMDYHTRKETFRALNADQIPREDLPKSGEYLDSEPEEWTEYIKILSHIDTMTIVHSNKIHYRGRARGRSHVIWANGAICQNSVGKRGDMLYVRQDKKFRVCEI